MEKLIRSKIVLLIVGAILFNYLFWGESHGVNVFIFAILSVLLSLSSYKRIYFNYLSLIVISAIFLTSIAISFHGSLFSIIMFYISFALFIGYLHQNGIKSIIYLISATITSAFRFMPVFIKSLTIINNNRQKIAKYFRIVKLSLIPAIVLMIFYLIFINANPYFEILAKSFWKSVFELLNPVLNAISFKRFMFIIMAVFINAWLLYKTELGEILRNEGLKNEILIRKRIIGFVSNRAHFHANNENSQSSFSSKFHISLKLKNEFISAFVLLVFVNILLFIVNMIDFKWVWFGFKYSEAFNLKQFVHEGTYLLIISILLSIAIMLYFFRRNLNFYPKSKWIKNLAYIWLIQNLVLTISVAIRNFHYITYWGLAYKRIGVILFLIAVFIGLVSVFIKIRYTKTSFYLVKWNSLSVYCILLIAGLINWDEIIAKHNLNHPWENHMETSYLLSLSDKVLPLIDQKQKVLDQDLKYNTYTSYYPYSYKDYYKRRVNLFVDNYNKKSWLSWNYMDWKAFRYYSLKGNSSTKAQR